MSLFVKLMIALLVIGGLAPFTFLKGKDGEPLMNFADLKMPQMKVPDLPEMGLNKKLIGTTEPLKSETVYKWKNKEGIWQFTNEPPPKGQDFSINVYDPKVNVIQSVKTKSTEAKKRFISSPNNTINTDVNQFHSSKNLDSTYSPEKVKKLFNDTNNLENVLNDRMKKQNEILNNL